MRFDCELKFVIPHFSEVKGQVVEIQYQKIKERVFQELQLFGLNYYMTSPMKEVLKGVAYDAEMIIVYCGDAMKDGFVKMFEKVCEEFIREMDIDMFTYIHNGVLVTVEKEELVFRHFCGMQSVKFQP